MEAASTDVLTPGAPITVNANRALACTWTAAPASVRNVSSLFFIFFNAVLTFKIEEDQSYNSEIVLLTGTTSSITVEYNIM